MDDCIRCGEAEIEWVDTYCQDCWEYYSSEAWWLTIPAMQQAAIHSPTLRRCGNCEHWQSGFCHLPGWENTGLQPRNETDPSCLGWARKEDEFLIVTIGNQFGILQSGESNLIWGRLFPTRSEAESKLQELESLLCHTFRESLEVNWKLSADQ